jgi:hypothetical protein
MRDEERKDEQTASYNSLRLHSVLQWNRQPSKMPIPHQNTTIHGRTKTMTNPEEPQQPPNTIELLRRKTGMTTGSRKSLGTYGSSLGTYNIEPTHKGNEEFLEMSYQTGETRRSSVQIRPAPPTAFFCADKQSLCGIMYLELGFPKTVSERRKLH